MSHRNEVNEGHECDPYRKYEDLLGDRSEGVDPDLVRLLDALDSLSTKNDPPASVVRSIGRVLNERAAEQVYLTPRSQPTKLPALHLPITDWRHRRFRTMPRIVALLLASLVLIGATYAVVSVIDQAFYMDESTAPIASEKLGVEVNQSRTIDGFTVSVKRVYADPQLVVVGYTVSGPPERKFNTFTAWGDFDETPGREIATLPTFTDALGRRLGIIGHVSENDVGAVFGTGVLQGEHGQEYGQALKYRTPDIPETSKEIRLRFKIGKLTVYEQVAEEKFQAITVTGPFEFEFTVPVAPQNSIK